MTANKHVFNNCLYKNTSERNVNLYVCNLIKYKCRVIMQQIKHLEKTFPIIHNYASVIILRDALI